MDSIFLKTGKFHHREFEVKIKYSKAAALQNISQPIQTFILFKVTVIQRGLSDSDGTQTHNHLVRKRTLNK